MATRTEIRVGDKVRSYDFPGFSETEYVEGIVEKIGYMPNGERNCKRYHIRVERVVVRGQEIGDSPLIGELVFPPINGSYSLLGGKTNGVRRLVSHRSQSQ